MARSLIAALIVVVAVVFGPAPPAGADRRLEQLCRNPAFANMHEHECVINRPGGGAGGKRSGGLLDAIGDLLGGLGGLL